MRRELGQGKNYYHDFFVDYWGGDAIAGGKRYPSGALAAQMLNVPDAEVDAMREIAERLALCFGKVLYAPTVTPAQMGDLAEALAEMNAHFEGLPMYRALKVDTAKHKTIPKEFRDPGLCRTLCNKRSLELQALHSHVSFYAKTPGQLRMFQDTVRRMEREVLTNLDRRGPTDFAAAIQKFFDHDSYLANETPYPLDEVDNTWVPFVPLTLAYVTVAHPEKKGQVILAERAFFESMQGFLLSDFYRGLQHGHAPMRCANCGRYFLTEKGYSNRKYCDGIDPADPSHTCRQNGTANRGDEALGKEAAAGVEPAVLCSGAKNKFNMQRRRGVLSEADAKRLKAEIDKLKVKATRGKLTDKELEAALTTEALYAKLKIKPLK